MSDQLRTPAIFTPGAPWIACLGPRPVLDDVERRKMLPLPGLELLSLGRLGRSIIPTALSRFPVKLCIRFINRLINMLIITVIIFLQVTRITCGI
jgi:hypothetical protein